ncbi:hypothetical protein [Microbispora bryophytorum]|uniref:ABC transporter permease n=1 Tax=Microbispora bryophytorum subsp. camponoti TaxID=1677852 RepID=A0ABR8L4N1_9ACTN|nr:hypothetical protein [Microbispora camponoti]MBD3144662.1 hypothetical protein [Microbispora camponoti]
MPGETGRGLVLVGGLALRRGRTALEGDPARGLTLVLVILMAASALAVTFTGRLAEIAGN